MIQYNFQLFPNTRNLGSYRTEYLINIEIYKTNTLYIKHLETCREKKIPGHPSIWTVY